MAKKQTRRSISVSRMTYERLKAFCESNNISMSQLVETRVNDFLGEGSERPAPVPRPVQSPNLGGMGISSTPRPAPLPLPMTPPVKTAPTAASEARPTAHAVPMTSAAARFAVEPPPPIIKPRQETAAPKPAEKRPDQIFTF